MPRWESDAKGRLERAALDLFEAQGFERTTVAQIARAAGLGERSFYRYFPDKREVLFADGELEVLLVAKLESADPGLPPLEALLSALGAAEEEFRPREFLLRRSRVIAANPALAERELIKVADISGTLARALERRGADPDRARLAINVALAVFRCAAARWLDDPDAALPALVAHTAGELRELVTVGGSPRPRKGHHHGS